eukprot:gene27165-24614_t
MPSPLFAGVALPPVMLITAHRSQREGDFFQLFLKTQQGAEGRPDDALAAFRDNIPESARTDVELADLFRRHCRRRAEKDRRRVHGMASAGGGTCASEATVPPTVDAGSPVSGPVSWQDDE